MKDVPIEDTISPDQLALWDEEYFEYMDALIDAINDPKYDR